MPCPSRDNGARRRASIGDLDAREPAQARSISPGGQDGATATGGLHETET